MRDDDLRSFLLVADTTQKSLADVVKIVDRMDSIVNWYKFMPSAIIVVSTSSVKNLSDELHGAMPNFRFLLTELERGKKAGWLPESAWAFMNRPEPVA